jgi:hypothetical protein
VLSHKSYATREDYDRALVAELNNRGVVLVCLAGFMRLLSPVFVDAFPIASSTSTRRSAEISRPAPAATGPGRRRHRERRHRSFCEQGPGCRSDRASAVVPVVPEDTAEDIGRPDSYRGAPPLSGGYQAGADEAEAAGST